MTDLRQWVRHANKCKRLNCIHYDTPSRKVCPKCDCTCGLDAALASQGAVQYCASCQMHWDGPYADCPGCQAQAGMKAVSDLQTERAKAVQCKEPSV